MTEINNFQNISELLLKSGESFTPLINLINKAIENYQKIYQQNISQINNILSSIENNLESISINKINNIKSLIKSDQKSFLTYINDTKVSLNKIIMKSKEISILIMTHNKQKNPIDIEILSSEIKLKEDEIINVKKEMSYYKDKYNSINQSFIEAQKTVSDLKEENYNYRGKIIEMEKSINMKNMDQKSLSSNISENINDIQIEKLKNQIKELNNEIETKNKEYKLNLSKITDKHNNLTQSLFKKNQEYTKLQNENLAQFNENISLKKQLEKKNIKESEYSQKIGEYQKQIEEFDKDLETKNSKIVSLTDTVNNNKILIKSLETELEQIKLEKNNSSLNNNDILKDFENCKKEKEEIENELNNLKKIIENNDKEYKQKLDLMQSTLFHNNDLINEKDEMIQQLKLKHQNMKESILNNKNNIIENNNNINPEQINQLNKKIEDLENAIKLKDDKIEELNQNIKSNPKDNHNLKNLLNQYKNDIESNHSLINFLKEQIKKVESENNQIKEELQKKNSSDLLDMADKMIKLETELDKYKNGEISKNMKKLEKKYNQLKNNYDDLEKENLKYQDNIKDLQTQISVLNKLNNKDKKGNKQHILIADSSNLNLDDYNKHLENLIKCKKENEELRKKIKELESKKNIPKESTMFKFKSIMNNDDYEEEIDMMQLEAGVRRRNRSEDFNIDYPGLDENNKKYKELEDKFNKLKEYIIPIIQDDDGNQNLTKSRISKIYNLIGININNTNNNL